MMRRFKQHSRKVRRLQLVSDMKIGDDEYMKVRSAFMKEEYDKEPQKPNGMYGHWGWFVKKERELQTLLREQGKLEE